MSPDYPVEMCPFNSNGWDCRRPKGHEGAHQLRYAEERLTGVRLEPMTEQERRLMPGDVAGDARETREQAITLTRILERCSEELARLEMVPTDNAEDVNALSSARGFVSRARNVLRGRFGS